MGVSFAQSDQENSGNYFLLNINTIIILGGTISISIVIWALQSRKQKRDKVWELYRRFHSKEFLSVRNVVWDEVHKKWDEKVFGEELLKDQVIKAYSEEDASNSFYKNKEDYDKFRNYLDHISIMLYFWTEVHINIENKTVNKKLTVKVFCHMYTWWRQFLKKFLNEYNQHKIKSTNPNALWTESISKLDKEFEMENCTFKNNVKNEIKNTANS